MVVETGDLLKRCATGFEKGFATFHLDFFEGFQAIGGKRRADHEELLYRSSRQSLQLLVSRGREPRFLGETRLVSDGVFLGTDSCSFDQLARGGEALGFVASRMRGGGGGATIGNDSAMRTG